MGCKSKARWSPRRKRLALEWAIACAPIWTGACTCKRKPHRLLFSEDAGLCRVARKHGEYERENMKETQTQTVRVRVRVRVNASEIEALEAEGLVRQTDPLQTL